MNATLQKHGAKHVYRIPEGLRELCADISREVLRAQPENIYCFIADYIDALLITRDNAKVAVKIVNNIILGSESIIGILHQSGLSLEQIAIAATRIQFQKLFQKAFRSYLDAVDIQQAEINEKNKADEKSHICIREILESTGTTWEQAENAASTIQAAFRSHYEEMLTREARGEIQWQRAVINTISILRKAGVSQEEAAKAATFIQSSYRGYYTRRNIRLKILADAEESAQNKNVLEPRETIQAVAWMDMMFDDSKYTIERANEAATIIQSAFRGYRVRAMQHQDHVKKYESSQSMVVQAILDNLRERIWSKVKSIEKFPEEYGTREEMEDVAEKIETEYKNRQRKIKIFGQLNENEPEEEEESFTAANFNAEALEVGDDNEKQSTETVQEFGTAAEIVLKEEQEDNRVNQQEITDKEPHVQEIIEHTEHEDEKEKESSITPEPEVKREPTAESFSEDVHEEHME